MDKLPITGDLKRQLMAHYTPVTLVDENGNMIGTYVPKLTLDDIEVVGGLPTLEETEAARKSPGPRHTTAEVIAHLRSLG